MKVAIERRTLWFDPKYEVAVGIVFTEIEQALIETHKLYDHRILTDLGKEILLKDMYKKTLRMRFKTPALAGTFDEHMTHALATLKSYLEYTSAQQPGIRTFEP